MKNHTKVYFQALGYDISDTYIPSEISRKPANDLHHIVTREDRIENLMALTRDEHLKYGEIKSEMVFLLKTHRKFLRNRNIPFENDWFKKWIEHYANQY